MSTGHRAGAEADHDGDNRKQSDRRPLDTLCGRGIDCVDVQLGQLGTFDNDRLARNEANGHFRHEGRGGILQLSQELRVHQIVGLQEGRDDLSGRLSSGDVLARVGMEHERRQVPLRSTITT